jgi:3-hydroxyisobutyrate dehydrogenase
MAGSSNTAPFTPPERVGFIGLGNMGAPMARRLAGAGYKLVVTDAVAATVERFAAEMPCETDASALRSCRVVITMLPDGRIVRDVLLGSKGLAPQLARGSVVVDMSSSSPVGTRELYADLAKIGIPLIDAPVSGGVRKAIDGTLAIMVGGDDAPAERVRPVMEPMGKPFRTGGPGSGHATKALNNFLSAANLLTAAEAMLAGERFGLDPKVLINVLNASTGRNSATDHKYPNMVLPRTFDSGFAIGLMAKDLRLALEVARAAGTPTAMLEDTARLYSEAEKQLGARADNTEIVKYLESMLGK